METINAPTEGWKDFVKVNGNAVGNGDAEHEGAGRRIRQADVVRTPLAAEGKGVDKESTFSD